MASLATHHRHPRLTSSMGGLKDRSVLSPSHHLPSIIILFVLLSLSSVVYPWSSDEDPCSSIIPRPASDGMGLAPVSFSIQAGYFHAVGKFLGLEPNPNPVYPASRAQFFSSYVSKTSGIGIFHIRGSLYLDAGDSYLFPSDRSRSNSRWGAFGASDPRYRRWINYSLIGSAKFDFDGYWSQSEGKVCMIGSIYRSPTAFRSVLKLNFTRNSTILTSLITGTLESLESSHSGHFDSISILGYNKIEHEYTLISLTNESCTGGEEEEKSLSIGAERSICSILSSQHVEFKLEYGSSCGSLNCNPLGKGFNFMPDTVAFNLLECSNEGRVQMFMTFSNTSFTTSRAPFIPDRTLVGEGLWNDTTNRLCITACRIKNFTDSLQGSYVADCSIRMSLRFPTSLTIRNRSRIGGRIWSSLEKKDSDFFDSLIFRSLSSHELGVAGLRYDYTETERLRRECNQKKGTENSRKRYPDGNLRREMRFSIYGASNGSIIVGHGTPLFLGEKYQGGHMRFLSPMNSATPKPGLRHEQSNVSYSISFHIPIPSSGAMPLIGPHIHRQGDIAAEGIYNADTGSMCLAGCRYLGPKLQNSAENISRLDCEIIINVQFPPLNPSTDEHLTGTIRSTREKSEPLYFEQLKFSSLVPSVAQTEQLMKVMDLEIVMVLITLTLACAFIGSQLLYVKNHPEALPSISILMVAILTLGLMIPLVLNFEALFFGRHNNEYELMPGGGWLKANEILVRVITMVAFLLQFRLLQLTVAARRTEASEELSAAEHKVLKWCLPLYLLGGLIAWLVHLLKTHGYGIPKTHHSFWEYLLSYAGLVLDGFLLPQLMLNVFSNSKGIKAITATFYGGMTIVRGLPHLYDAYRAQSYLPTRLGAYIYADPSKDFYSTAWDIIIPFGGLVLAILVSLQHRFGGGSILPARFKRFAGYEQVSEVEL